MKKTLGTLAAFALSLCLLSSCGSAGTEAPATTEGDSSAEEVAVVQTATDSVDFKGKTVVTRVDVSGGMSVEFTTMGTVYLFEGEASDDAAQVANGYILDHAEYEQEIADYQDSDETYTEVGAGFIAEDGSRFVYVVGDDVCYKIQVNTYDHPDVNCDDIFSRFEVSIEE